jgi:DNA invertase Pin-like site-specific DNA recombinase
MSEARNLLHSLFRPRKPECPAGERTPERAFSYARVSTDTQEERGLSLPEQLRENRQFAERKGFELVREFQEAESGFRHQERRHEFHRMLELIEQERVSIIIVHDRSRWGRNDYARTIRRSLQKRGVQVLSVTDPYMDPNTSAGLVYDAVIDAKNEGYSIDLGMHTKKGCRANIKMRDSGTGWCYKNGGQPPFGYRAERLHFDGVNRGRPIIKSIWVRDETVVAGRTIWEWARHCLVELAGSGASLVELCEFCNKTSIPGRRNEYWGTSTWHAILQPHVLLQYCGVGVWNVHDKRGRERPVEEWSLVDNAHEALITEEEAKRISGARNAGDKKKFGGTGTRARSSNYLLSGGLFKCDRCGANMISNGVPARCRYVCGSQPYRNGMGCGPGVYVPQKEVEAEVLRGLRSVLDLCSDPGGFTAKVNHELRQIWQASLGFCPDAKPRIAAIEKKITNIRRAIEEDGLNDVKWANSRLSELARERDEIARAIAATGAPPQIDTDTVMKYRRDVEKVFQQGDPGERKRLLRNWVQEVKLKPESLEVSISYRLPESVMNGLVAGEGFEPSTFGL